MVGRAIKARGQVTLTKLYDGTNGAVGAPGEDGKTTYVHVAYSSSADGKTDFSVTDPSGRSYIGVLTDFTEKDSTNYSDYTWSLVKGQDGEDGSDGTPGKPGADGRTPYVHFSYANSADGKTDFSTTVYANKKFIGTLTDYTVADSTDYTKYTWSRLKGESGVGIANTVVEYQITDTQDQPSDDSGWTSSIPNLGTGSYLWTRTTFFYTDGTTSRAYTISKQSDNTYTAVLTNDSITLPSDSNGKVTDFSNSTGNFLVYDGTYQVDSTTIKIQLVQAVNVTVTLGGNAYTITAMDSTKDTGYFDLSYTYKGVALTKRVSVSKSKSGENGTTPIIVNLSANAQVFTFDSNNHANPASQNILFKTTISGTTATPVYKAIPYDSFGTAGDEIVMSNSGTNGKLLQVSQLKDYTSIIVTASVGTVSDSTTIVRVKDGSSVSPIPDPSNTVSSNTPPTDAKDGDWWNDTSQTPNVLKYRYRDKWVQYELDGYYVKANSISGEAIVTNTLEAQKIKYTNSNGTTTNLQTFDFDGMKTVLSDNNGNTYSSMDTAVGSTKVVSNIQSKVNSLGQINQLSNTEFTPDFSGWYGPYADNRVDQVYDGQTTTTTNFNFSPTPVNGSQGIKITTGPGTSWLGANSKMIPVVPGTIVSLSVLWQIWSIGSASSDSVVVEAYWYTSSYSRISNVGTFTNFGNHGASISTIYKSVLENREAPANAAFLQLHLFNRGQVSSSFYQPMVVFGSSVGDYVPGQYNNNDRVSKIEQTANDISLSVGKAQSSADTANQNLANASKSGIRYLRFRSEGNSDNSSTHFSEISVYSVTGANVISGKSAILSGGATTTSALTAATDGNYSTYLDLPNIANGEKYAVYDMGSVRYDIEHLDISMYSSTRTYYNVLVQSSIDNVSWETIYRGNITPDQLIGGIVGTTISFGMDTSSIIKLAADNYTMGIDANGNLVSGISGNKQQVTLKGSVIHLDGNTIMDQDFFSLWNGKYGSTTIDSTGMEVRTGLSKTKFTNGNMQFITDLGENIGYIGRQVDSVHNNLDYLTFGLNGWHTTYPGDSHYEGGTEDFYGGDGILFGISNADGGYAPLLQWNSGLAASYKSSISGWLFTQPIVGGIDIYGDDYASNKTVSMRFKNVSMSNGFTYPLMTSQQAAGSTGIVIGSGNTYILGGNSFVWSAAGNGYAYYNTQKRGSSGSSLLMASDGAIVAQTSATKYKSDIEYEPSTSYGDKLLTIDPATWSDKNEKEQIQKYRDTGQEPEYSMNKDGARYYGLIAEDMVKAGLEDLIVRNTENGSVEGIQYEKIGIALIPLLREQRKQINELRVEIERLKEKTNE